MQRGSAILHGETDAIERAGRRSASVYRRSVLYTTLSPCIMCAGTAPLYEIPRIVVGENRSFEMSEALLRDRGVQVDVVDDAETTDGAGAALALGIAPLNGILVALALAWLLGRVTGSRTPERAEPVTA